MARRLVGLIPLAIVFVAIACSGVGGGSDAAAIRALNEDVAEALNDRDTRRLYGLVDAQTRKDCPLENFMVLSFFATLLTRDVKVVDVRDIVIDGSKASAITVLSVAGREQTPEENRYVKEGGNWKLVFLGEGCAR